MALGLVVADASGITWAQAKVAAFHYLHKAVDPRSRPLVYLVRLDGVGVIGTLIFGRTQATACYAGGLTYGSPADVASGRAAFDRWEVLNLARVWLERRVQAGWHLCREGVVPGYYDRRRQWRSTLASTAIRAALARVGFDYLVAHPPCFVEEPYQIRAVLSYCDTRLHRGTIYRAAGFALARRNADGIETWWTPAVATLTAEQDAEVRRRSEQDVRARRVRGRREQRTLFA